jgi:hypothetical protein
MFMSTADRSSSERFDKEYPATLPARLQWLENRLDIDRNRILRLMGLSDAEASSVWNRPWSAITAKYEAQADRAEHLLTHYLSYFDYDATRAKDFPKQLATKVEQGVYCLNDHVPALASATTPSQREAALLAAVEQEGPGLLPALASLLAVPERNGPSRKHSPS